ncbi:hypothetical protein WS68_06070 [Burkholderia sp. TSV86]|nr:hypothetical protein WS68_06070 [Burkholderia sp. TSV86]
MAADGRAPSRAAALAAHDAMPGDADRDDRTLDLFGGALPGAKPLLAAREAAQPAMADVDERQRSFEGFDWPAGDAREAGGADTNAAVQWPAHDADGKNGGGTADGARGDVTAASAQAAAGSGGELDHRALTPPQHAAASASEPADDPQAAQAAGALAAHAGDAGRDARAAARADAARAAAMPGERDRTSASVDPAVPGARAEADMSLHAGRPAIDTETAAAGSESSARRQTAPAPRANPKRAKSEPKSPGRGAPAAGASKRRAPGASAKPEPAMPSPESRAASGNAACGTASASAPQVAGASRAAAAAASASLSGDQTSPVRESAATACDLPGTPPPCAAPDSVDIDTHIRPLADKLRVLQAEIFDMRRAAGAEMRRVNRLLLGLGVMVLFSIAGLIVQSMQASRLRTEAVALQQRIDRLVAEQMSQQASLVTLSQRLDEQGEQVGRLTNHLAGAAKPVKRPYHGH